MKQLMLAIAIALTAGVATAQSLNEGTDTMQELSLFLTVRTQPGQRDAFVALWLQHLQPRAAGNEDQTRYVFALDLQDENVVRISEVYANKEAFEQNAGALWFQAYMNEAQPLLDGEPEYHMAAPVWVK